MVGYGGVWGSRHDPQVLWGKGRHNLWVGWGGDLLAQLWQWQMLIKAAVPGAADGMGVEMAGWREARGQVGAKNRLVLGKEGVK